MKAEWVKVRVEGKDMRSYLCRPSKDGPAPALLVLPEIFGVNGHIQEVTERLAKEGYVALAPEVFHRTAPEGWTTSYSDVPGGVAHMSKLTAKDLITDMKSAAAYLVEQTFVQKSQLAAIGFCLGGRMSYLANTSLPLKGAISFYGANIPQWLDRVSSVNGPNLFFWGGKDAHIDLAQREQTMSAFTKAGKEYTNVVFSAADHGFFCNERGSYHPTAAAQAWAMSKEFLKDIFSR